MTYQSYSLRNNITDKDLAGLFNFLEREMGWEIKLSEHGGGMIYNPENCIKIQGYLHGDQYFIYGPCRLEIPKKIFFRTYRTLLPAIRDLYSK